MVSLRSRFLMLVALARRPVRRARPYAQDATASAASCATPPARRSRAPPSRSPTRRRGAAQTVTSGADGSLLRQPCPPGVVHGRGRRCAASAGRRRKDVKVGGRRRRRGLRAGAAAPKRRSRSRPCCASRPWPTCPFSVAAPTEDELRQRGVDNIEGVAANVAGFTVQNLGPRPEPGRHARRLRRPDRARPAGRQGAGGRLPRRLGHLPLPVHAGPRPVRRRRASRCCAGRRARSSAPARSPAPCATSATSPSSA